MNLSELMYRLKDPSFIVSHARNAFMDAWDSVSQDEFGKIYRSIRPYTMVSNSRLRGLYRAINYVVDKSIEGDIVECGTARGGSAALMGSLLKQLGSTRKLWIFDSFEGMPEPTENDPDREIARKYVGTCRGDEQQVAALLDSVGVLPQSKIVKGLFQDTLPECGVETIAVLHIDGDWYESVKVCLEHLYDRVAIGGVIQLDDYGYWTGARKATDEFLMGRNINLKLEYLDYAGRQLIKRG